MYLLCIVSYAIHLLTLHEHCSIHRLLELGMNHPRRHLPSILSKMVGRRSKPGMERKAFGVFSLVKIQSAVCGQTKNYLIRAIAKSEGLLVCDKLTEVPAATTAVPRFVFVDSAGTPSGHVSQFPTSQTPLDFLCCNIQAHTAAVCLRRRPR